jgi:hypothetical protein
LNLTSHFLLTFIFIIATVPFCFAEENPTVDFNITVEPPENLLVEMVINNPGETDLYMKGLELSISDPVGESSSFEFGTPLLIKESGSVTRQSRHQFYWSNALRNFYLKGSTNITFSGKLFFEKNGKSLTVPFRKDVTVFLENEGAVKAIEPEIALVDLEIDKLTDTGDRLKEIRVTTNISIYNPNTVPFILHELDYEIFAMDKKGEKSSVNCTLPGALMNTNKIIGPGETYVYSRENRVPDGNGFVYLSEEKPQYLRVRGTSVLVANGSDCSPFYFEPKFNTLFVIDEANKTLNNTDGAEINPKTSNQGAEQKDERTATDIEQQPSKEKSTNIDDEESRGMPGFEIIYCIAGLSGVFLCRKL